MLSWSRSRRPSQRRWSSPDSFGAAVSASARNAAVWRRSISSRSPLAASCSAANSRIVSSMPEAGLAVDLLRPDEALVGEGHQPVEDLDADLRRPVRRRASARLELAAADEHGEPREQPPLALVEQVVAPGDRAAQRLLALRQVARAGRQDAELVLEPLEDRLGLTAA